MIKLNVPYRSQWGPGADKNNTDCGPTCVAMILNFRGVDKTPDGVYDDITEPKGPNDYTTFTELILAVRANEQQLNYRNYSDRDDAFNNLRTNLDKGNPAIALVNYHPWDPVIGNGFQGGHFVVVTGYDNDHIYINDPLFGNIKSAALGHHHGVPNDLFASGWGSTHNAQNPKKDYGPNWSIAYNGDVVDAGAAPAPTPPQPQPQPVPTPTPVTPTPMPTPPAPTTQAKTMDDINRRIRALAAYRWAESPDFNNPASLQVWLDNLGDFGLEYEEYVVKSGDSLSALAARHYGSQNRWPAIKAYNDLQRDGLWVGETIMIPRLGQSGAHLNPALPSDTADFSKDIEFMLIDPEAAPLDYNELVGDGAIGIGYVDLPDA